MPNNNYTLEDIRDFVGDELTDKMMDLWSSREKEIVDWFYNWRIKPYDNMTPKEMYESNPGCLDGLLEDIKWGNTC